MCELKDNMWTYKILVDPDNQQVVGKYYKPNEVYKGEEYVNIPKRTPIPVFNLKPIQRLMFMRNADMFLSDNSLSIYFNKQYNITEFCKDTKLILKDQSQEGYR